MRPANIRWWTTWNSRLRSRGSWRYCQACSLSPLVGPALRAPIDPTVTGTSRLYYRDAFDPDCLRAKGWPGQISEVGGWGGGVMNGGAWLTIDDRHVDIHYRDLDEVEHWCREAESGRFNKELLLFYAAGIPTYVVMAELATDRVLLGDLPRPSYPELLAIEAGRRWNRDALAEPRLCGRRAAQPGRCGRCPRQRLTWVDRGCPVRPCIPAAVGAEREGNRRPCRS